MSGQGSPATASPSRILVLDDEEGVRLTLQALLEQKGYDVSAAATAAEARRLLDDGGFDLILADLRLDHDESGVDMLRDALQRDPDLVTIILTAYVSMEAVVEALRGGATNFLAKPCSIPELTEAIERGLEKRTLLLQLREARHEAAARREAEEAEARATRLYQELQRAHGASELLATVGKELTSSLGLEELIWRLARALVPAFADWCVVDVVEAGFQQQVAVAHADPAKEELARELQQRFPPISSKTSPMRQVLDSREPRWIASYSVEMGPEDGVPRGHLKLLRQLNPTSIVSVPLLGRRGAIGVMSFLHSDSGRQFTADDVNLAQEVANRAALAIENAQLYRDTEGAAGELREAEERQRFLAEASKLLDASLEYEVTLNRLAQLVVPKLADWCIVDVIEHGQLGQSVAIAAADPTKVEVARQFQQRWPPHIDDPQGTAKVIRTGQPEFAPDITDDMVATSAHDPEHLEVMRALGPWSSGMAVPLTARGKTLGALTLIMAESGRKYRPEDLEFALDLAGRAAVAVDNARLYEAEQRARREAERLQALTEQLGSSIAGDVLDQVAATAAELLDSPVAGVFLLDAEGKFFELVASRGLELGTTVRLPRSRSLAGQVIASGKPATVADVRTARTALPRLLSGEAVGSLVVAPIIAPSGPLGVMEVYSPQIGAFEQHQAELLAGLAGAAAAALENARLYRQRETDLARLQTIMDQLPVGVVVVEAPSGQVALSNQWADLLYGDGLRELQIGHAEPRTGRRPDGRALAPEEWPLTRALMSGETVSSERIEIARPDGGRSFLSVNAAPIRDPSGAIVAAVAVYDDVSDEEQLRREKDQFLAAAAHDLKTPLTSITGLVQLLERQLGRLELPQSGRLPATLGGIQTSVRKMAALIDELLDISRLESMGTLSLARREVDLVALARSVVQEQQPNAPRHEIMVAARPGSLAGLWDEGRLERAISNLIGNAVKYSPEGGKIQVRIASETVDGAPWAMLSVRDQGIGIPAGDLERIFERFQRGSNIPDKLAGSGVGLSYVNQIVMQHGGCVLVQSRPGKGSTFTIKLPLEAH
ncbi:MAG TPA: GAF domain-containing protein [Chloroflexota bacterium]